MFWVIYFVVSIFLALIFSRGSAMSKGWAIFYSVCFTPILAFVSVLVIGKYGNSQKQIFNESKIQKLICLVSVPIIIYLIYALYLGYPKIPPYTKQYLSESEFEDVFKSIPSYKTKLRSFYLVLLFTSGLIGNIIYMMSNSDTYIKDEEIEFEFEKKL